MTSTPSQEPGALDFMTGCPERLNGTRTCFIDGVRHDGAWDAETMVAALTRAARDLGVMSAAPAR